MWKLIFPAIYLCYLGVHGFPHHLPTCKFISFSKNSNIRGVSYWDGAKEVSFISGKCDIPGSVTDISFDKANNPWFCCAEKGIATIRDSQIILYANNNSNLPPENYNKIAIDNDGKIWLGTLYINAQTSNRLISFYNNTYQWYNVSNSGLDLNSIANVYIDKFNNKWFIENFAISTNFPLKHNISIYDNISWHNFQNKFSNLNISSFSIDNLGNPWVGDSNKLWRYDGIQWNLYDTNNIPYQVGNFKQICTDKNDNLWIITKDDKFLHFDGINWIRLDSTNSPLPSSGYNFIKTDAYNNKWIGTTSGLFRIKNNSWTSYTTSNSGLASNNIIDILIENEEQFLIGNDLNLIRIRNGIIDTLFKFDNHSFERHTNSYGIFKDRDSSYLLNRHLIWSVYLTHGYYDTYEEYSIIRIKDTLKQIFSNVAVTGCTDLNGKVWMAGLGLSFFKDDSIFVLDYSNSKITDDNVNALAVDKDNNIWIATNNGVAVYNKDEIKNLNYKPLLKPTAPLALKIEQNGRSIKLTWNASSSSNVTYRIFRSIGNDSNFVLLYDNIDQLFCNDSIELNNTNYYYFVKAYSDYSGLESDNSNEVKSDVQPPVLVTWKQYNMQNSLIRTDFPTYAAVDGNDLVWLGNGNPDSWINTGNRTFHGLQNFNGKDFHTILYYGLVSIMKKDLIGNIRASIWDNWGEYFNSTVYFIYIEKDNLDTTTIPFNHVMYDMDFLNNNDLVFGNREGVWIFRKSDTLHIDDTKGLLEINVTNICVDRSGSNKIYIGTESHGLAMYDFNKWTYWNTSNSNIPINASITDVGVDSKGNVWLGHDHLIKFDGTNWTDYGGSCTALAIDKYDNIWVGGNNGLGKFDSSSWTWYNTSTCGLPAFVPTSIAFDSHDTKWIGTDGYGLIEFNENGIVTGIRENPDVIFKNDSFNMIIYPNPTTRIVNLHLTDFQNDRLQIDITDLSGNFIKSIFDGTYAGQELNFDLSGYPSGSYFLKAVQKDKTQTYKVIKAN